MSSIRISKVLSELNIGLDTAVDFLLSKDHEVEKNRNTKISDEQYALLLGNFASDKSHKDQAESIISQKREEKASAEAAAKTDIGWGHQIRSYVLQPYQMVKDLRTGVEKGNPAAVLDGELDDFLAASLASRVGATRSEASAKAQ